MKIAFSLNCCISALPEFNQSYQLLDFFNLSRLISLSTLLYDSVNLVINVFSSGLLSTWFKINEVESAAEDGLCCTCALSSGFPTLQGNEEALDR